MISQPSDVRSVYASGTAYSLTNSAAALTFGTTSPAVTIPQPGTYLLLGRARLEYNGATFAASRLATIKLVDGSGDITNATSLFNTDIITTLSYTAGVLELNPVLYTTTDAISTVTMKGLVSVVPSAGTLDVAAASIMAIRLF